MHLFRHPCSVALALAALMCAAPATPAFLAAQPAAAAVASSSASSPSPGGTDSLEQAAKRAGDTARKVAMYLIGLAFAAGAVIRAEAIRPRSSARADPSPRGASSLEQSG